MHGRILHKSHFLHACVSSMNVFKRSSLKGRMWSENGGVNVRRGLLLRCKSFLTAIPGSTAALATVVSTASGAPHASKRASLRMGPGLEQDGSPGEPGVARTRQATRNYQAVSTLHFHQTTGDKRRSNPLPHQTTSSPSPHSSVLPDSPTPLNG